VSTEEVRDGWHRHLNGGGWVQDTAAVEASAFVGPDAWVFDDAWVYGDARVYGDVSSGEVTL